jgi:hypothetical protein
MLTTTITGFSVRNANERVARNSSGERSSVRSGFPASICA